MVTLDTDPDTIVISSVVPQEPFICLNMGLIARSADVDEHNEKQKDVKENRDVVAPAKRHSLRVNLKKDWEINLERTLLRSLCIAKNQYRIRLGLAQSLRVLEFDPKTVLICILPVNEYSRDSLSHLQVLLIEAYCNENSIRLLKVYSPENLWSIVKHNNETDIEDEEGGFEDEDEEDKDDGVVLILARHKANPADNLLCAAFDSAVQGSSGQPVLKLTSCESSCIWNKE